MLNVKKALNRITRSAEFKTLLWTNPNPMSAFSEQTISLDLSGYDAIDISMVVSRSSGRMSVSRIFFNAPTASQTLLALGDDASKHGRNLTFDTTGITFKDGYYMYMTSGAGRTTDNGQCIPYKIYGIKLVGGVIRQLLSKFATLFNREGVAVC